MALDLTRMKESTRVELRKRCLRSLFAFCIAVMGYDDMTDTLHRDVCTFLEAPGRKKQLTLPRGFLKTCTASIAFPIWISLPREATDEYPYPEAMNDKIYELGTNIRVLIASNVVTNAMKIINNIKKIYERNSAMMVLFPETIPTNFSTTKWSDMSACINRTDDFTESTFEAAGVGGSAVSRHYDIIIEDDLIYAKKDDLTGKELQPDQDDIDKAVGWHKLAMSLLVPGPHVMIHNVGTRWAKHDLVDFIRTNEKNYAVMDVPCAEVPPYGNPTWPELFGEDKLKEIYAAQGPYMYATQYLNQPMSPEEMIFKREWLQIYTSNKEVPLTIRKFTTVDLSLWGKKKRERESEVVVMTCGWDDKNHMWLLHYDKGRFNPSEVIGIMAKHQSIYSPESIGVEVVYYQEALVHFARKAMEDGDVPWMNIKHLVTKGESKEVRIRALEPIASNLALHCKPSHVEFIMEFCEYVPNNDACKKDLLDTAAYQFQLARPGEPLPIDKREERTRFTHTGNMDGFLEWAIRRASNKDSFGNDSILADPYNEGDAVTVEREVNMLFAKDPWYDEKWG